MESLSNITLATDLRTLNVSDRNGICIYAMYLSVSGDNLGGWYTWNMTSTIADDGIISFQRSGISTGRWLRVTNSNTLNYNDSGLIAPATKIWSATVSPSTSNGYSIDISSSGFTTVLPGGISIVATRNTSTVTSVPNVAIKTISTTAVVVNITEANPNTTTILGIPVLSGAPNVFANTTGLSLEVTVKGY